jgi:hypothetical protein
MIGFTTEHVEEAIAKLLQQYKGKPNIEGFVSALAEQVQSIENMLKQLFEETSIDTAVGVNLDIIGVIVGLTRTLGQADEDYREDLRVKVIQNLNEGTPQEFIDAALYFIGATYVEYSELYPASVGIVANVALTQAQADAIKIRLEAFLPAGVSLGNFGFIDPLNPFKFNVGSGFGDFYDAGVGGLLSGAY